MKLYGYNLYSVFSINIQALSIHVHIHGFELNQTTTFMIWSECWWIHRFGGSGHQGQVWDLSILGILVSTGPILLDSNNFNWVLSTFLGSMTKRYHLSLFSCSYYFIIGVCLLGTLGCIGTSACLSWNTTSIYVKTELNNTFIKKKKIICCS